MASFILCKTLVSIQQIYFSSIGPNCGLPQRLNLPLLAYTGILSTRVRKRMTADSITIEYYITLGGHRCISVTLIIRKISNT